MSSDAEQRLRVGANSIEYLWLGPSACDAPTIVLLHEGLGCVRMWRDFPQRLQRATGLGVMVYSRPGHGQSGGTDSVPDEHYMHEQAECFLPALLDAAALREALLLGHSDGGSIAAIHAGFGTDKRLRGLITIAAHFFVEDVCLQAIARIRERYLASIDRPDGLRARLARYHHEQVDSMFHGWADTWLSDTFAAWDIRGCLGGIKVPMLALQGLDDEYGTRAQLDAIRQRYHGARLEIGMLKGLGHAPHLEQPATVLGTVRQFCREIL